MFLMPYEIKLFNIRFKKLLFFSGEPLRVFHHCFFRCFYFTIVFAVVFGCFHCWLHLLTSLFTSLHFTSPLRCYTASATDLRKLFLLSGVFYLTLLHDIWYNDRLHQPALLSRFPCSLPFCLECGCRASHYGSKHRPGPSACLNHTVFSKRY